MMTQRTRVASREGYTEVGHRIADACELKDITMRGLAKELRIPWSSFMRWCRGARLPHLEGLLLEDRLGMARGKLAPGYEARRRA